MDGQATETVTTTQPTRGPIAGWIDDRLPIISLFEREYVRFLVPRNLTFLWNVGAFVTVTLLVLVATGFFLSVAYTPDPQQAFASVEEIDRHVNWGWLLRSVHQAGATLIFALLYIHTWRSLYYGSFKRPRELVWLTGMLLLSVVIVSGFLGYVLPWGQMSYWGAVVSSNAIAAIPGAGPGIAHWLQGGDTVGAAALHRAYAFHFLLGMLTLGVVALHVAALHVVGSNNPTGVDLPPAQMAPFHPHHTGKSLLAMLVFLLVFVVLAFFFPMSLTQNDNFVPANPASTPASIAPAWYFLQFYAILRAIPGIGGVTLAIGSVLVLFAVPWLDSSPVRSARYRPRYRIAMFVLILDAILLSLAGSEQTAGIWMPIARLATLWWFFHFLVLMPYLGRHERTLPLPTLVGAR
jgi:ubiquinol-cytochrome c reductase cytochrome b subunit